MRRRAQSSIPYILLFAATLLFVLFTFKTYRSMPRTATKIISTATENYTTTASRIMNPNS